MKLVLTGLANETDFKTPGEIRFLLVFNDGALRVAVSQEAAQEILEYQLHGSNGMGAPAEEAQEEETSQEEEEGEEAGAPPDVVHQDYETSPDSDGVDQI